MIFPYCGSLSFLGLESLRVIVVKSFSLSFGRRDIVTFFFKIGDSVKFCALMS